MSAVMTTIEIEEKITLAQKRLEELKDEEGALQEALALFVRLRQFAGTKDHTWLTMRLHEACKRALTEFGKPLSSKEIAAIIRQKGVRSKSENLTNLVYVTMNKRAREDGYVFEGQKWALREWKQRKTT